MRGVCLFLLLGVALCCRLVAQPISIDDFMVKENLSQNGKLAVIAVDSTGRADDRIQGTFNFSVNGFLQRLRFTDGVAVMSDPVETSTFVLFKHKNQDREIGKYYLIRKTSGGLRPYKVNGMVLILLPLAVLLVAYIFKRLLVVFVVLALLFAYLHISKGMEVSQLFESFFISLRNLL